MRVTSNSKEVAASLDAVTQQIERKLKNMVEGFAVTVANAASSQTPKGDDASLDADTGNGVYIDYYDKRQERWGIPTVTGYHRGAWQYTESTLHFMPVVHPQQEMLMDVETQATMRYKLGDTFKIGAIGPGYKALENGSSEQAPSGIMQPTSQVVMQTHAIDLKLHFDKG